MGSPLSCTGTGMRQAHLLCGWLNGKDCMHTTQRCLLSCLLRNSLNRHSESKEQRELCRMGKTPWVEPKCTRSRHSRGNYSCIMAQCPLALQSPSYRTGVSCNPSPYGHAADRSPPLSAILAPLCVVQKCPCPSTFTLIFL